MKHAYFTRLFDNIGFKCKIICHFKISEKAGIQFRNTGFPRIKYGAGLVKPGMTKKGKGLLKQYISFHHPLK